MMQPARRAPARALIVRAIALVVAAGVMAGCMVLGVPGADPSLPMALAAARADSGISLPVGSSPAGLAVSPDGTTLFVASPSTNTVIMFNTVTRKRIATIPIAGSLGGTNVGSGPEFLQLNSSGSKLYVSMAMSNAPGDARSLVVIDTATRLMLDVFSFPGVAFPFTISPDGSLAYVPTFRCGITVLDLNAGSSTPPMFDDLGKDCVITNVIASPDGRVLYALDPNSSQAKVLDATTSPPRRISDVAMPGRAFQGAITPSGTTLALLNAATSEVDLMAVSSSTPTNATLLASIGGGAINDGSPFFAMNRAGTVVYRSSSGVNQVDVIDVGKKKVIGELATGKGPGFLALNASGSTLYTSNGGDGTVSMMSTAVSTIHSGSTGSQPIATPSAPPSPTGGPTAAATAASVPSSISTPSVLASTPTSASGLSPLVIAIIAVVVLLLAAVAVLLVVLLRRNRTTPG